MYRTKTCGELRLSDAGSRVTLAGWVQRVRKMGGMTFLDLRDRYGLTQVVFNVENDAALTEAANHLGREYVVQVVGDVAERTSKNPNLPTGDIEIVARELRVLNPSEVPPFTIEDDTDGGDDLRMRYRYLDLRRNCVRRNLELRHRMTMEVRRYLDSKGFLEIETPMLVGSTPEGARDFVVPSRMNPGQFYALPQSPQTLKQLLMVSGIDRYFQIVKCFRDEDLRADRQPEFTQIDCEMSYVEQDDIINLFEGMARHLFKELRGVELPEPFQRMPWADAMKYYGSDKPDLRFGMRFVELMDVLKGHGFSVFDEAEYISGFAATGCAAYTRKQIDSLTEFVKRQQIGAKGLVWIRVAEDGVKSSIDKIYSPEEVRAMAERCGETLHVHIEKALYGYEGVYPATVQEFARCYAVDGVRYLNREDDAGDRGLRTSKLQYLPCKLAEKCCFDVKNEREDLDEIPTLKTERLTLSAFTDKDREAYNALCLDDERNKWWGYDYRTDLGDQPLTDTYFYDVARPDFAARRAVNFAVRLKGRLIGEVVLYTPDFRGGFEQGCRIAPEYAGHGYGAEAFAAAADWALYHLGHVRVVANCFKENEPSRKMLSACMRPSGEDDTYFYFEKTV